MLEIGKSIVSILMLEQYNKYDLIHIVFVTGKTFIEIGLKFY